MAAFNLEEVPLNYCWISAPSVMVQEKVRALVTVM
jgi:hypothetical protein